MKVLHIGQLPKEVGGNYTTGAANVLFELSKQQVDGVEFYTYGTNIKYSIAQEYCSYPHQYIGYKICIIDLICSILSHPMRTLRQWKHFCNVDHENILRYAFYQSNIKRAINKVKPDIIHVHSIANISPTRFALEGKKIPILLTCHGIFYRGGDDDVVNRDKYWGNVSLADAYSGLTMESMDEYESLLGVNRNRVRIIPNGVDCNKFYFDEQERLKLRQDMKVATNTKVLITVASIQERKGQYAFIKLLKQLKCNFQYWLVGTGTDVPMIEEYIRNNGLKDRVKLLGYRRSDELYKYYSAADIYAHVGFKEGQALCEIEANAAGLRTIVNAQIAGTIPSLDNGDYFVYDPFSPNITSMELWIEKEEAKRMSRKSLDWQVIADKYVILYKELIK